MSPIFKVLKPLILKKKYTILFVISIIGISLFLIVYYANQKIEQKIETSLSNILTYDGVEVNVFSKSLRVENPKLVKGNAVVSAAEITLSGISYYDYLINDRIVLGKLFLESPKVVLTEQKKVKSSKPKKFTANITINTLEAINGQLTKKKNDTATNSMFLSFTDFKFQNVVIDSASVTHKIPFEYSNFGLHADSLRLEMGELHTLTSAAVFVDDGKITMKDTRIIPKYDKVEFQQHIPYEKDRYELFVDELMFSDLSWEFKNDSLYLRNPLLTIKGANFEVYRNKLMPDDTRIKEMYSAQIRKLPVKIDFEKVGIGNSSIIYEEKAFQDRPPLKLSFKEIDATIENIVNIGLDKKDFPSTKIAVQAIFMELAPLKVDWSFNSSNLQDRFNISGTLGALAAPALNTVLKPAMNIKTEGKIVSLAFNYSGNRNMAQGDMRIQYKDFKVIVLRKDGTRKNKFLSAVVNLFVGNKAISKNITHKDLQVERVKTKSFWNYLWLMIRKGALKAFL